MRLPKEYRFPTIPFIICANHASFFDIPCLYVAFQKRFTFVGKKEITRWPLFRIFYTSGMNISVDRGNGRAMISSYRRMESELREGHSLVIFPEGTISRKAPEMSLFKSGAFQLAVSLQLPVIPVTIIGNHRRLQRGSFLRGMASPGRSTLIIHQPVFPGGYGEAEVTRLKDLVYQKIRESLPA